MNNELLELFENVMVIDEGAFVPSYKDTIEAIIRLSNEINLKNKILFETTNMSDNEWIPDEPSDESSDDDFSEQESCSDSESLTDEETDEEFEEDLCGKCGRTGHTDEECYARKTIDGKKI